MDHIQTDSQKSKKMVWLLGVVSFLTDLSSDMILPTLAFYITGTMGASALTFGLIEGVAEATSALFKGPSGWLSDYYTNRKPLVIIGYTISFLGKLTLPLSTIWSSVLSARFLDRIGKGIRTSPRDGMLADGVPKNQRGWAFGVHRGMDSAGAVAAPLIAFAFLTWKPEHYTSLYWIATIPALLSVLLLFLVGEIKKQAKAKVIAKKTISPTFKAYLIVMAIFSLMNSSDLFLLLRLEKLGWSPTSILLAYAGFNAVAASGSILFGQLSDKFGRSRILRIGFGIFCIVYVGFALATPEMKLLPFILLIGYGLFYALTDGVGRAYASDLADSEWRGFGLGIYHTIMGLCLLPAGLIAGYLFDVGMNAYPFYLGAIGSLFAIVGISIVHRLRVKALKST